MVLTAGCGRKASHRDAAPDAFDANAACTTVFDRMHKSVAGYLEQLGLHETAEQARQRDHAGMQACIALKPQSLTCLLKSPVEPAAWTTCNAQPVFSLFDATADHVEMLGAAIPTEKSAEALKGLAGTWVQHAHDETIEWTIALEGSLSLEATLAIRRTRNGQSHDEPKRTLALTQERLLAIRHDQSTQFAPMFHTGNVLFISWTSGAMAIPMKSKDTIVLDLASKGRWLAYDDANKICEILDPARGASPATCAWQGDNFVVNGDDISQSWELREDFLVHPQMEMFTRATGS